MFKFAKSERLCNQVLIQKLFSQGHSFTIYPFKIIWIPTDPSLKPAAQILISVPRKYFKHAVVRNLLKRRIKEIYRKNKNDFYQSLEDLNRKCLFALIYTGRGVMKSSVLEPKIIVILQRLIEENVKAAG